MTERVAQLRHDGLTFDVFDEGPLDGEVVVLLHGFPERSTAWREVAPLLHAEGYRTVAMDQRGYSPGARPHRRRDYRTSLLIADAVALADAVGGPVHLVGHDWGAMVAWGVAMQHPDRLRTLTALSVPHPWPFLRALGTSRQGLKSWYMGAFQLPRLPERLGSRTGRGGMSHLLRKGGMTEAELARFRAEIVEDGALPGGLGWYRAMALMDARKLRIQVPVPTTMVWSDGDMFLGRAGVDRTGDWVDAPYELVVLEGATHWLPTQEPQAVADAILARARG